MKYDGPSESFGNISRKLVEDNHKKYLKEDEY